MCKFIDNLKTHFKDNPHCTKIAIVMHDNPDPDCIASGLGMAKLLSTWNPDIKCTYVYTGEISHSQNKTLINVLNIPLVDVTEIENLIDFHAFITVDVTPERCAIFNEFEQIECLATIDHHRVETEKAKFTDIRPVGATSSLIFDYFRLENVELKNTDEDATLATALLVGIKTDTQDFITENVTDLDFEAYKYFMEYTDRKKLSSIVNYPIPSYLLDLRSQLDQEGNFKVDNGVYVGGIGHVVVAKRDVLPTLAAERSRLEEITTAFIFAIVGDHIEVSVRSISLSADVNALCQKIFGKQFSGGKMGAGAAKIPLGFLALDPNVPEAIKEKQWEFVREYLIDKIFHVINNM